jgi:hypothetical protein
MQECVWRGFDRWALAHSIVELKEPLGVFGLLSSWNI